MCGTDQSKIQDDEAYQRHRANQNSPFMVYTRSKMETAHVGDIQIHSGKTVSFNKTGQFSKVS